MKRNVRSAEIEQWLRIGGLNTDGMGPQVAELVLRHPDMLPDLLHELRHGDERIRGWNAFPESARIFSTRTFPTSWRRSGAIRSQWSGGIWP